MSIAIIDQGQFVWTRAFGVTRATGGVAVTDDTRFEAASLSKPVTAYIALQLVDARRLNLDTPLSTYVTYADLPADPRASSITARHVLSHTTGFPNWRRGAPLTMYFSPGERFSYSGEGYVYLQRALEAMGGATLDVLADRLVFSPLGMTHSSFLGAQGGALAAPHSDIGTPLPAVPPMPGAPRVNAAASLVTTASDYAKFVAAAVRGDRLASGTANTMFASQVHLDPSCTNCTEHKPASVSNDLAWGLGWGLEESGGERTIWHWGDNPGYKSYVAVALSARRGFVFFSNSDSGLALRDKITEMVIGGSHPAAKLLSYDQIGPEGLTPRPPRGGS